MLKNSLPKIISQTLPGPKAAAIIERRKNAVPNAIRCIYPCVMAKAEGAMPSLIHNPEPTRQAENPQAAPRGKK
ncbi:hypothetical protein CG709_10245, partial [Lachnotalea glycerini]